MRTRIGARGGRGEAGGRDRARGRGGFTLIEVMIAMHVIAFAMVILGGYMLTLLEVSGETFARSIARSLAVEYLEEVRRQPYAELQSQPAAPLPEEPNFTRTVTVRRVGSPTSPQDYKIITVEIKPPGDIPATRLTTAVAAS